MRKGVLSTHYASAKEKRGENPRSFLRYYAVSRERKLGRLNVEGGRGWQQQKSGALVIELGAGVGLAAILPGNKNFPKRETASGDALGEKKGLPLLLNLPRTLSLGSLETLGAKGEEGTQMTSRLGADLGERKGGKKGKNNAC